MSRGLVALHDPLSPPDWLVRILRPVVQPFIGAMLIAGHDLVLCGVLRSKLIGNHHPRRSALALQKLAHQALGCLGISAALHKNLQGEPVLIHSALQPTLLSIDRNHGFIEVPFIAEPTGGAAADLIGESSPKFLRPQPNRPMRDNDRSSRQQVLDYPQAERKPEIQPNGVSNDFSGKAMAATEGITGCHRPSSHIEFQLLVK